jgi:hypothetical protein
MVIKVTLLNDLSFSTKEIGSLGLDILQKKLEGQGVSKENTQFAFTLFPNALLQTFPMDSLEISNLRVI